jgi:hypothetical protein
VWLTKLSATGRERGLFEQLDPLRDQRDKIPGRFAAKLPGPVAMASLLRRRSPCKVHVFLHSMYLFILDPQGIVVLK